MIRIESQSVSNEILNLWKSTLATTLDQWQTTSKISQYEQSVKQMIGNDGVEVPDFECFPLNLKSSRSSLIPYFYIPNKPKYPISEVHSSPFYLVFAKYQSIEIMLFLHITPWNYLEIVCFWISNKFTSEVISKALHTQIQFCGPSKCYIHAPDQIVNDIIIKMKYRRSEIDHKWWSAGFIRKLNNCTDVNTWYDEVLSGHKDSLSYSETKTKGPK